MKKISLVLCCLVLGGLVGTYVGRSSLQGKAPLTPPPIPKELTSYRDIVKNLLPAVVSIESRAKQPPRTSRSRRRSPSPFGRQQVPEEFRRFFQFPDLEDEGPETPPRRGFGSGFLVDAKGVVLTNFHVVEGADEVEVQLRDGRKFTSKEIKSDPKTDLAIVRIDAKGDLPYLELGDSDQMEIGDRILAIGAPFGLTGTVTHGIISAKGRALHMNMYEDFLQTDAAINPGNSGGPLVSLDGRVIGINSAIKSRSGGFQGIGLAISSNLAKNIMQQLEKHGVVRRGYLGIQIRDVDNPDLAERLGLKPNQHGVLITEVFDNTPASKAGIKDGDVIVRLDGREVKDGRDLQRAVARAPIGKPVDVAVIRDGKQKDLHVKVEEQPQQFGRDQVPVPRNLGRKSETVSLDKIGVSVTDLTPETAENLGYKESARGVLITKVDPDSVADEAGLRRGMLISKVDKKRVNDVSALREAVESGSLRKGILLQVHTPGGSNFVLLKSKENARK